MYRITATLAVASMLVASVLGVVFAPPPSGAQEIPKSLQSGGTDAEMKLRKNAWTVGIAGGIFEGTFFRFAEDMRKVVDDGDEMRVMPIVTRGVASNVEDLLYVKGVDVAVTQSDVFEFFRTQRKIVNLPDRIHYLIRFPVSEVAIIARSDIHTIEDLRGKKVDFGDAGSSGSLTSPIIFQRLGISVRETPLPAPYTVSAYMRVASGEVDAAVRVVPKPVPHIANIPANSGLHLISIPFSKIFADYYAIGEFTNTDYPNLVAPGERVDTLAVPTVLAVYNWPKGSERYNRVSRFVQRLFERWDKITNPPYHPKWRDVNLAANVPGWKRFAPAEEELAKLVSESAPSQQALNQEFNSFLASARPGASPAERETLFRDFMRWRDRNGAPAH